MCGGSGRHEIGETDLHVQALIAAIKPFNYEYTNAFFPAIVLQFDHVVTLAPRRRSRDRPTVSRYATPD
jgi:hypothetical protein